jgi:hypothetical protein
MKTLLTFALVLFALFMGVACLDVTPYPLVESDAGSEDDASADAAPEP